MSGPTGARGPEGFDPRYRQEPGADVPTPAENPDAQTWADRELAAQRAEAAGIAVPDDRADELAGGEYADDDSAESARARAQDEVLDAAAQRVDDARVRGEWVKVRRPDGSYELVGPDDELADGANVVAVQSDSTTL